MNPFHFVTMKKNRLNLIKKQTYRLVDYINLTKKIIKQKSLIHTESINLAFFYELLFFHLNYFFELIKPHI